MAPSPENTTHAALRRYDFGFLTVGLVLVALGFLVSPGAAAYWLHILGGTCVFISSTIRLVRGIKERHRDT
jgi:hypothetical protein